MAVPAPDLAALRQLGERVRPLTVATDRVLAVPEVLAPLLPAGGLQRGSTVATSGSAATSLALALVGPATEAGSWLAVVGMAQLGLLAAAELGVVLERTLLVADPGPAAWPAAVAALLDAFEVVLVQPGHRITPTIQRRLLARARDRGAVLIDVGGSGGWADPPDVTVRVVRSSWEGLGAGHGRLGARRIEVEAAGRRGGGRPRRAELWLPGPDGRLAPVVPLVPVAPATPAVPVAAAARSLVESA